ncbi:MAG: methionine--tRNA ligase [Planctomycetes bacterium GWF2_41_51]|nr:MAG: methionine--tRNA ligase [Planctomycetes bacterium GWF2_41_51]
MNRKIVVTSALPYANGPIHIGHLVEYLQTDIWVRFQKANGNQCLYFCADDTHGTPIMISARNEGIQPEDLIKRIYAEHTQDFAKFHVQFDNFYSTHSDENRQLSSQIFKSLSDKGSIVKNEIEQAYCEKDNMFLPDRFIRGTCPKCKSENQYGDSCDNCGATYQPTDLINPVCSNCGTKPVIKKSIHYFFRLADFQQQLKDLMASGYTGKSVANKLDEWFSAGLKDWDISRDGPYFGFKIPGEENKFFYVWLDAPIGYIASCKNYCDKNGLDFDKVWNGEEYELYHFIGKDIMYFHALFWPAMLMGSGFKVAKRLFVHGFLTVNGVKMSKSKGTFIKASTYAKYLDPEYLRYYYASKLTDGVDDIDLNLEDFVAKVNSDLVGKLANLASRSVPMLGKLGGMLGSVDAAGKELVNQLAAAKQQIINDYEKLDYASVIRQITALADIANRYVEVNQPWATLKTDAEKTRTTLTVILNAVKVLAIYLKPVLPVFVEKIEKILGVAAMTFADVESLLENKKINEYVRLAERVEKQKVDAMVEESKSESVVNNNQVEQKPLVTLDEPLEAECTIDDFKKVDLRVAKVLLAEKVAGADKLLHLELDIGGITKNVFAGVSQAYQPEQLVGRLVICCANLQPRKMKFGVSEGMVLAAGPGGKEVFMLGIDSGAKPGQRVH